MYILTDKDNVIQHITETLDRQEGNNYYLIKNKSLAIPPEFIREAHMMEKIDERVEEQKYCYTKENGFYKNENYKEYYNEEDRISALEDMINMILFGGNNENE